MRRITLYAIMLLACLLTLSGQAEAFRLFKIGDSREVKMGQEVAEALEKEYGVEENARVAEIGRKVAEKSDRKVIEYSFKVLKMDEANAFACPGGFIYITKPLLNALNTDDEIAVILGHEIAHVAKRHSIKEYEKAMSAAMLIQLGLMALGANETIESVTGVAFRLMRNGRSRKDENEADEFGARYAAAAGFDPNALFTVFEVFKAMSGGKEPPKILATHPPIDDRVENVRRVIREIEDEKAKEAAPAASTP